MAGIAVKNSIILYYGNRAGYIEDGVAVVDPMFKNDSLGRFLHEKKSLELHWQEGVLDRLSNGKTGPTGEVKPMKNCRLHQLKADVLPEEKFLDFEEQLKNYGMPGSERYEMVYDCQIETNNLEEIYLKFENEFPQKLQGHPISISDVIELYDAKESEFYYIDHYGFQKLDSWQLLTLRDVRETASQQKGADICQRETI